MTISAIVCAYNEAAFLPACLHSLFSPDPTARRNHRRQQRQLRRHRRGRAPRSPASAWSTNRRRGWSSPARRRGGPQPATCWPMSMPTAGRRLQWLERIERRFERHPALVAVTGPYRFYDWDLVGRSLIRAYDVVVAPPTHLRRALLASAPARFSTAATSRCGATRSSGSAGSIGRSSFTARTRISAAG